MATKAKNLIFLLKNYLFYLTVLGLSGVLWDLVP